MNKTVIGLDLGTSSVKAVKIGQSGVLDKAKASYQQDNPEGWYQAVLRVLRQIGPSDVAALGLSSQVGTYIVNEQTVLGWSDSAGSEEAAYLRSHYSGEQFIQQINMPHPAISSYPLPRLMYIKKHWPNAVSVCQPKDFLCEKLAGRRVTDPFSWRGLANVHTGAYSSFFLRELGVDASILPNIQSPADPAGRLTPQASAETGLPENTAVYVGMNDFYCSLVGMGMTRPGEAFDITGTSEHLGIVESKLAQDTSLVSSPFLDAYVHYGVTGSSGASLEFGMRNFGLDGVDIRRSLAEKPPVFLPYLNGERAPVFDGNARGVFFGISQGCTASAFAYSVLEGNVFSLYSILERLGQPAFQRVIVSGGAAKNPVLNKLKAAMLNTPVCTLAEENTSALGAAMVAAVGAGFCASLSDAVGRYVRQAQTFSPEPELLPMLLPRYRIYSELYPSLKHLYPKWKETVL